MKKIAAFLFAFAAGLALAGQVQAQTQTQAQAQTQAPARKPVAPSASNAPINISSDTFQADLNGKTGTWQGNVVVAQGDMKLRANSVRMTTVDGKADKVLASGNVVVDSPRSGTATGDNGVYNVGPRTVVMTGNVVLKKGRDVMRGAQLTVNLATGQAMLGGGARPPGAPAQGGRVQGVFIPNSQ
ncbi:MAG: lipopolysaccharide transport periplasmic protein LptA [Alphaproteobacteria bacterium 65-7]|nr:MAG: lipopolysaccharide transport periplasmic protein LptA [Alphaproteobacteria bacterium 65-7]